jgi:CRISPR type III-A-associated RAMP protein Csm4
MPGLFLQLQPTTPWRPGPDDGRRDAAGLLLHSDTIYAAVAGAMLRFGMLDDFLAATAAGPAVRFTSGFPYRDEVLLIAPPRHLWPAPSSGRVRTKGARFVPVALAAALANGEPWNEDRWAVDASSRSLVPRAMHDRPAAVRESLRSAAAVDRIAHGAIEPHRTACVEFAEGAGYWLYVLFDGETARARWRAPVETAFRWLADSGVGGERSRGWGRFRIAALREGSPEELIPAPAPAVEEDPATPAPEIAHWLLSLYTPGLRDRIDWRRGHYSIVERGGWVGSPAGAGLEKKRLRMVEEGSVLFADAAPEGSAPDVAPEGAPHPVYRNGYAVSLPIPWRGAA